ncbi:hypothetical protein [Nocardia sp. NPDC057353]|uniref:hypothetical protein n=1 Tax=Nocardia sp. NPDC057353 TaxID=3346104 RepID=UPI00362A385E
MRDENPTGHAEIAALAHQVATARGKLPLQHDNALLDVLSDGEVAAERELAEWIRAQRRGQRRRAMQDELDAEKRDRRADAALRRTEDSDARWHRKALAARRRVASQDARIAQLYRRAEWSSRALIGVVVLGMVWAGVNVQRNLVPSGDMSDPLYWLSYGIEAMISIPIIVIMIAATTAARWGRELPRGRVILVELALLGTTIGLNAGPHLASGQLGKALEFAIAPIMVGVVIWLHSWVAARYAQLIDDASVDLPIDSMVEAPAARTQAFAERYPAPQGEVDLAELVARAHAEFEQMGIEASRTAGAGPVREAERAPDRTAAEAATGPVGARTDTAPSDPADVPQVATKSHPQPGATAASPPATAVADASAQPTVAPMPTAAPAAPAPMPTAPPANAALTKAAPVYVPDAAQSSSVPEVHPVEAAPTDTRLTTAAQAPLPVTSAESVTQADPASAVDVDNTPVPHSSTAPAAESGVIPTPPQLEQSTPTTGPRTGGAPEQFAARNGVEHPAATAAGHPTEQAGPRHPATPKRNDAERPEQPTTDTASTSPNADSDQRPVAPPRAHLRAVTVTQPPTQEPLPFTEAAAEARQEPSREPVPAEPKDLTSALTSNEPEASLPNHDPVIESDEAGAWAAAKTIVARGWSKVPVEQLAEILEMADRSRSAASIGAEMGLPRSVVDQAMQAAHKLSRTYAMTS